MAVQDYLTDIQKQTAIPKAEMNAAGQKYAELLGGASSLPYKLKEALQKKLDYNKDLIQQREQAMADYFSAPGRAREKYQNVFNPFTREKLVEEAKAQALQPVGVLSDVLNQRMGQVSDIIGQGVAGWQGMVNSAGALANLAERKYNNALSEYMDAAKLEDAAQRRALAEKQFGLQQEEFNWKKPWQEKLWGAELARATRGGSGGTASISSGVTSIPDDIDSYAKEWNQGNIDASQIPTKLRGAVFARSLQLQAQEEKKKAEQAKQAEEQRKQLAKNAFYRKFLRNIGQWLKSSGELRRPHWF